MSDGCMMHSLPPLCPWDSKPHFPSESCVLSDSFLCHTDENEKYEAQHRNHISPERDVDYQFRRCEPGASWNRWDVSEVMMNLGPRVCIERSGVSYYEIDVDGDCDSNIRARETQ